MCDLVELLRKNTSLLITRGGIPVGIKFYEVKNDERLQRILGGRTDSKR